jgi:YlmC/YmxH family sporulation protein
MLYFDIPKERVILIKCPERRKGVRGMRGKDLEGKEVIELTSGERLGIIRNSELLINLNTGVVEGLILRQPGFAGLGKTERTIFWSKIRKISAELIIVEETAEMASDANSIQKSVNHRDNCAKALDSNPVL